MFLIDRKIPWLIQPQYPVKPDPSHNLFSKLAYLRATYPSFGSEQKDDRAFEAGPGGYGIKLNGGTVATSTTESGLPTAASDPFTLELLVSITSLASLAQIFGFGDDPFNSSPGGSKREILGYLGSPLHIYFYGENADADSGLAWEVTGIPQHVIVTWSGSGNVYFYKSTLNGSIETANVALSAALTACVNSNVYSGGMHRSGTVEPTAVFYKRAIYKTYLVADQAYDLIKNTWANFQPQSNRIYSSNAGGLTLALTDATHAQTADSIALTQAHFLILQEALSAHLTDAIVLTQAHNLTLAEMLHAQSADNVALSQVHVISVSDAGHAHSADSVILTQAHNLTLQEATHPHLADVVVLGAAGTLVVSDGLHAHLADGLVLTQQHVLLVQVADHVHAADTLSLTQAHNLTLAEALHAQLADNVVFSGGVTLVLTDAVHPHSADGITISVAYSLAIQDAIHATLADNPALGQVHQLIVSNALHDMLAGNIAFTVIPTPDSRVLLIKAENRVLVVARS